MRDLHSVIIRQIAHRQEITVSIQPDDTLAIEEIFYSRSLGTAAAEKLAIAATTKTGLRQMVCYQYHRKGSKKPSTVYLLTPTHIPHFAEHTEQWYAHQRPILPPY